MLDLLHAVSKDATEWMELRFHARQTKTISARNGQLEESSTVRLTGVGIRTLIDGVFGFASTTDLTEKGIRRAMRDAQSAARVSSTSKKEKIERLAQATFGTGSFRAQTDDPLDSQLHNLGARSSGPVASALAAPSRTMHDPIEGIRW